MKVIFLLDDDTAAVFVPEKLQLRQLGPGQSAIGVMVGENQFRPLIYYPVNLTVAQPIPQGTVVTDAPAPEAPAAPTPDAPTAG